jgi:hypothetical protein
MAAILTNEFKVELGVRDNEGLTALELFREAIKFPKPTCQISNSHFRESFMNSSSSNSLWTWGKNNNYLLGDVCDEGRQIPEQIVLADKYLDSDQLLDMNALAKVHVNILQVSISRYHALILADHNRLYSFG